MSCLVLKSTMLPNEKEKVGAWDFNEYSGSSQMLEEIEAFLSDHDTAQYRVDVDALHPAHRDFLTCSDFLGRTPHSENLLDFADIIFRLDEDHNNGASDVISAIYQAVNGYSDWDDVLRFAEGDFCGTWICAYHSHHERAAHEFISERLSRRAADAIRELAPEATIKVADVCHDGYWHLPGLGIHAYVHHSEDD